MKTARIRMAIGKGVLATIGVALISTGMGLCESGDLVAGGIVCGVGAIVLVVSTYVGR